MRWTGEDSEGTRWTVEVEADCFTETDGLVVALWTQQNEDGSLDAVLAELSSSQARETAAELVSVAAYVERVRAGEGNAA